MQNVENVENVENDELRDSPMSDSFDSVLSALRSHKLGEDEIRREKILWFSFWNYSTKELTHDESILRSVASIYLYPTRDRIDKNLNNMIHNNNFLHFSFKITYRPVT